MNRGALFSLLGIILTLIIISFLAYQAASHYFKSPAVDNDTRRDFLAEGIDSSSPKAVLNTTRQKVKEINRKIQQRQDQYEEINNR